MVRYILGKGMTWLLLLSHAILLTLEALREGGQIDPPLDFFGFKFLLLDRLSKALAELFLVCEHIFWN